MSARILLVATSFLSLPCAAQIERRTEPPDSALETVIVTASRLPTRADRVGSSMTVLERSALMSSQERFVADALREVPGVAVSRAGGLGGVTQARLRGGEGNHTLVLIDGIEANNPVAGSEFDFATLGAADIERIEILRGPQSALYGSDAVAGVINVITRRDEDSLHSEFFAERGSFGTNALGAQFGGGGARASGGAAVSAFTTDGENPSRFGAERDGYKHVSTNLYGKAAITGALTLSAVARLMESKQSFDSQDFAFPATPTQGLLVDADARADVRQSFVKFEAQYDAPRLRHQLSLMRAATASTFFDADVLTNGNDGRRVKLDYELSVLLDGDHDEDITVAFERELLDYENHGANSSALENQRRKDSQTSVAAEYRREWGQTYFSASARLDDNALFRNASTYRLAASHRFNERTRMHTSLGTGVSNPGFFELFGFFPGSFVGNPTLHPELSTSIDIGISRAFGHSSTSVDITYFYANLTDEIQTVFDESTFLSTVVNLDGESRRHGLELALRAQPLKRWHLTAGYTYTDSRQADGRPELRRPRHIASLNNLFELARGRARIHVGVDYSGKQSDAEFVWATPSDRVVLDGFTLIKIAGDYEIADGIRLYGRIENVRNERYEEVFSYRGRSRSATLGVAIELGE